MLDFEQLSPEARAQIERLMSAKGLSRDEAVADVVIEAIAMGGLTFAGRPKAGLKAITGPPGELGQLRDKNVPN